MFQYISEHPIAGVAIAALLILTVFVWIKAIISGKKRSEERERIIADIEREKALRKEFKQLDEATFSEGKDNYRLVIGICAHIQLQLEKREDMTLAFSELSEVKRYVYALGYVFEDSKNALSDFFRANGEPLLSAANEAVKNVISGRFFELFSKEYIMLDENDITTSVDNTALKAMDDEFKALIEADGDKLYCKTADYIRANKYEFIDR